MLPLALTSGCSTGEKGPRAGADLANAGPHVPSTEQPVADRSGLPPAPMTASEAAPPTAVASAGVGQLHDALAEALKVHDPAAAASMALDQRPSAENQLVVTWTVSKDPDDASAKTRVRREAITLLATVRRHVSSYGSVLLIADASVRDASGRMVDAKVVRAKYSRTLIERTDFALVSIDKIFILPDDKPAEIYPSFR
jgi:hypothetical protein